jgi:hypothetical protein
MQMVVCNVLCCYIFLDLLPLFVGLLILLLACSLQASALLAENVVYPLLVLGTLTTHIDNFSHELDQYLTVLAINHGSLAHHRTRNLGVDESSRVYESKVCVFVFDISNVKFPSTT